VVVHASFHFIIILQIQSNAKIYTCFLWELGYNILLPLYGPKGMDKGKMSPVAGKTLGLDQLGISAL